MANLKYIGKNILNHTLEIKKGNVSGSATSTGSFGQLVIGNGGDIILTEDQRIYFESDKGTYIETNMSDSLRAVAGGSQMLLLDYDTGNRAVFGNNTKVFIGSNNNQIPSNTLEVDGTISGSGILSIEGNVTASGNISGSGNIIGKRATFDNAVSASKVYAADGFYHSDNSDNTYLKFPTGDKVQINAGDVNFIYAWQKDSDVNKLIFNDDNTDTDIVFRSANGSNNKLLYLDASADTIGIKTGFPPEALTVEGNISASGALMGISHITASGNISASNLYLDEYIYHSGEPTQTYIRITDKRFRINAGGINYLDMNDNAGPPRDITFNDGSNNVDLTIKGSSNNPLFKTDASANRIGTHGKGTPEVAFHIGGDELRVDGTISGSDYGGNVSGSSTSTGSFGRVISKTLNATGNTDIGGNLTVAGNYTVNGTTTFISSSQLEIGDNIIQVNSVNPLNYGGIHVKDKNATQTGSLVWDSANDYWVAGQSGSEYRVPLQTGNSSLTDNKVVIAQGNGRIESGNITDTGASISTTLPVTASSNLEVGGNISGSVTSTGSFGELEVDTNATIDGDLFVTEYIKHKGDVNTAIRFTDNKISFDAGGMTFFSVHDDDSAPFTATINGGSNRINFRAMDRNNDVLLKTDSEAFNVGLYYAGSEKLSTQAGGVNITGHITASGHISGSITSTGSFGTIQTTTGTIPTLIGDTTFRDTLTLEDHLYIPDSIVHASDTNTKIRFPEADTISFNTTGVERMRITSTGQISGSSISTGSFGRLHADSFSSETAAIISGSLNKAAVSGSWRGELSSSAITVVGGGVSGSSTSTGSFGLVEISGMDIDPTGIARDQVLKFNGTNFVPAAYDATFVFTIADFDMNDSTSTQLIGSGSWKAVGALQFTASYNNGPPDGFEGSSAGAPKIRGYVNSSVSSSYDMFPLSSSHTMGTNTMVITYPLTTGHDIRFRLFASAGSDTDTDYTDQRIYFRNQFVYGDLSKNNGFNQADIRTLAAASTVTTNDTSRTLTVSVGGSNYLCFAHRTGDTNVAQVRCGSGNNILTVAMDRSDATALTPLKETVSYLNTAGFTENFYVYASKIANVDAHSTTFTTVTSTQKKNYFYWGYDSQASSYDESFLETSGDWDSHNANSSYDDGTVTGQTLSVGSFTSKYVIIAFPDRYGDNETQFQFKDNSTSLPFDVTKQSDVTITNAVGFQETYHVWRSTNLLTMTNLTVLIDSV